MLKTIRDNALVLGFSAFLAIALAGELAPAAIGNLTLASDAFAAAAGGN